MVKFGVMVLATLTLAWAILATITTALYYSNYTTLSRENQGLRTTIDELTRAKEGIQGSYAGLISKVVFVTVIIDYGNETVEKHVNVTLWHAKPTAFLALLCVASAEFQYSDWGVFVSAVNGVKQSLTESCFWLYHVYQEGRGFVLPEVAADRYTLTNGDIVSWNYTKVSW